MGSLPLGTVAVAVCVQAGYGAVAGVTLLRSGRPVVHRTPGTLPRKDHRGLSHADLLFSLS